MKSAITIAFLAVTLTAFAQQHKLELVWQTDTIVAVPESVLPHPSSGVLYVALIDGSPWAADGKGGIARLSMDGKKYEGAFITGLNAPKGMAMHNNRLYVADITELVVIDLQKEKVEKKIPFENAQALNDVTVTGNGIVYVSDSRTGRVWRLENDVPAPYLDSLKGLNGLKAVDDDLYIAAGRSFLKADAKKNITTIAELPQGGDGIEPIGNGDFLFTSWGGYIYYVYANGTYETLLDTHEQKKNTADIGYDPASRIMYVPTFFAKTVVAYRVSSKQ